MLCSQEQKELKRMINPHDILREGVPRAVADLAPMHPIEEMQKNVSIPSLATKEGESG